MVKAVLFTNWTYIVVNCYDNIVLQKETKTVKVCINHVFQSSCTFCVTPVVKKRKNKAPIASFGALCNMQLQKEVISMQKQPNYNKSLQYQKAWVKKDVKSKLVTKKCLWLYFNCKNLITKIWCWVLVKLGGGHTNSPELSLLKFLPLNYHHSHFLAITFDFMSFHLGATHFFHSLAVLYQTVQ